MMQKSNVQIIWGLLLMGIISMVYFISLPLHVPFVVTVAIVAIAGLFLYRWMNKNITVDDTPVASRRQQVFSYIALLTGIFFIIHNAWFLEVKYGGWDAWAIWNPHAKYLVDTRNWKLLYTVPCNFHPDYPLYLSGIIAFLWRLTGSENMFVPFGVGFLFMFLIPIIIYVELYRKNLPLAIIVLFLFAFDDYLLRQGTQQYADTPLAMLFLSAFICMQHYKQEKANAFITITAALLGCCMWTKNEGVMLSILFTVFNFKYLFAQGRWKYFIAGIIFPLLVLVYFKSIMPANDLVSQTKTYRQLFDPSRYALIWQYLTDDVNKDFAYIKIGGILYFILCIVERRFPDRNFILLLCCVAGYVLVYVLTPMDLGWHLSTSMERVLHQVMPAFIYVLALRFCNVKWVLGKPQA